jgi:hypothetical protein
LMKSDDPQLRSFAEARSETLGQPDEGRLDRARAFARETFEKVKDMSSSAGTGGRTGR